MRLLFAKNRHSNFARVSTQTKEYNQWNYANSLYNVREIPYTWFIWPNAPEKLVERCQKSKWDNKDEEIVLLARAQFRKELWKAYRNGELIT
jgi:hypothetical protein